MTCGTLLSPSLLPPPPPPARLYFSPVFVPSPLSPVLRKRLRLAALPSRAADHFAAKQLPVRGAVAAWSGGGPRRLDERKPHGGAADRRGAPDAAFLPLPAAGGHLGAPVRFPAVPVYFCAAVVREGGGES